MQGPCDPDTKRDKAIAMDSLQGHGGLAERLRPGGQCQRMRVHRKASKNCEKRGRRLQMILRSVDMGTFPHFLHGERIAQRIDRTRALYPGPLRPLKDVICQADAAAARLQTELLGLQRRLGTHDEHPGDFERASEVAHKLSNAICAILLARDL